jgi:hypothetical protein
VNRRQSATPVFLPHRSGYQCSCQSFEEGGLDAESLGPSINNEDSMKYRTMKRLDTYGFWGVVTALVCFLWWLFTRLS